MNQATGNGEFGSRDAATVLAQASTQARRRIEPFPPWLSLIRAGIALAGYGTIWLSVRDQHPYQGPTPVAIAIVIALAAVNLGAAVTVAKRAVTGIRGKTPLRPAEIAVAAVAWIGVFVVMAALAGSGASRAVYLGWYLAGMPLIVAGLAWAGIMVLRRDWVQAGTGLAAAAVGAASASAGPVGAWPVAAIGLCAMLVAKAAVVARRQRAGAIRS